MQDIERKQALAVINRAIAEALGLGLDLSVARMYGSNDDWAIMLEGEYDYDPGNGGFHVVEIDE